MNIVVDVQYAIDPAERAGIPAPEEFERWVSVALAGERDEAELSLRIVDAAEGAELNQTYRGKKGPTNVLSFPCESSPELELPLLGDVVICAPVVAREASEQVKPAKAHWAHMTVHGVLHLLGYNHEDSPEAEEMEAREADILGRLGFADPYASERLAAGA